MQFAELQASVITKQPYSRFREDGIAFEPFEEGSYTVPNKTISSSRVLANQKGDKNAFRGYWVRYYTSIDVHAIYFNNFRAILL